MKKLKFEDIKQYFKDRDCELYETEYINSRTKMKYRCNCGNKECKISFSKFRIGRRCIECGGSKKHTFKYVYNYFLEHDCLLKETEYINCKTLMEYECDCGNTSHTSFSNFKKGHRCYKCGLKKIAIKLSHTFDYVFDYFKEHNCELLETEYISANTPMRYKCDCGNPIICKITFHNFKAGQKCIKCGIEKISGENSYLYNPNLTDEEREKGRCCPGYGKWVKDVHKQNNDTCQYCFKIGGKLIAHHIESYGDNEELRIILFNGITFCEEHHIEFHKEYGYGHNNREQLEEFLSTRSLIIN